MMGVLVEGGCLCGAVRFSFREKPLASRPAHPKG